jgi:hypothetical protein
MFKKTLFLLDSVMLIDKSAQNSALHLPKAREATSSRSMARSAQHVDGKLVDDPPD